MRVAKIAVATLLLALSAVTVALAGPAVRVTPLRGRPWEGELVAMEGDALQFQREGEPLFLPLRDIRRIEFLSARAEAPAHDRERIEAIRSGLLARAPLDMLEYARQQIGEDRELGLAVARDLRRALRADDLEAEEQRLTRFAVAAVAASFGGRRAAVINALDELKEMYPDDEEFETFRERIEDAWRRLRVRRGGGAQP